MDQWISKIEDYLEIFNLIKFTLFLFFSYILTLDYLVIIITL
jgi:hypothetical protein